MPLLALIVCLCAVVLLLVSVPVALALLVASAQWAWESGFLATLAVAAVVITALLLLDPRERRKRS